MYNGKPASLVTAQQKATVGNVDQAQNGIVTRGVLLDITKVKGKPWLEAGEPVFTEDLEAAEAAQGVKVGRATPCACGWAGTNAVRRWARPPLPKAAPVCTPRPCPGCGKEGCR